MMNLTPRVMLGNLDLTDYPFAMEFGADLGVSQNIVRIIESGLADGGIQQVTGNAMRTLEIPVLVEGSDLMALALAEQMLAVECNKDLNEVTLDPGDGFAPVTVFVTSRAQWGYKRDDEREQAGYRTYQLSIPAQPFGYSEDEVIDVAVTSAPAVPSTTVISDGTSATNWSSPNGTITVSSGRLSVPSSTPAYVSRQGGSDMYSYTLVADRAFAAPVDFSATPFVTAVLCYRDSNQFAFEPGVYDAYADGVLLPIVAQESVGPGVLKVTWRCTDTSVSLLSLRAYGLMTVPMGSGTPAPAGMLVDDVQRSNVGPGSSSSGRESVRTVEVTGSARTAASVVVEHPTAGLGDVLFYTSSELGAGYNPALRRWLDPASMTVTPDATTASGSYSTGPSHIFNVDAASLPAGPHLLMVRTRPVTTTNMLDIDVSSVVGATTFGAVSLPSVEIVTGDFAIYSLGVVTLPLTNFPAESVGVVRIELDGDVRIDEVWAFYLGDEADLTYVKAGSGTPTLGAAHNRLFLDSPTIQNNGAPALYVGTQTDRSDAFHPGYPAVQSWGRHLMAPPTAAMFVVTTGAANPTVTLRHRPAWHTHAGQ